jgi:arginyl-tRNA synthetase
MILHTYKHIFASYLAKATEHDEAEILASIAFPPQPGMGDLAFPCFTLAKEAKKAPQVLATEIASQLSENLPSEFVKIIAV